MTDCSTSARVPGGVPRARADRCPGALTLHEAADGGLARIRLPGGLVDGPVLAALARLGAGGALELTSRGNVQLRGITPGRRARVAARVAELGLLPSATHERVRNIVASPLAGLVGPGEPDAGRPGLAAGAGGRLPGLVRALDRALCADPELAELSGRFLFGLDDGGGDIAALGPDAWAAPAATGSWWVAPAGVEVAEHDLVGELVGAARAFVRLAASAGQGHRGGSAGAPETRGRAWRVRDLADGGAGLAAALRAGRPAADCPVTASHARPVGGWRRPDGGWAVAVGVPLGWLTRSAADLLAEAAEAGAAARGGPAQPLRVTPWRGVVVPDIADEPAFRARAARAGLTTAPGSLWARVTACAGRPGCASAHADVRADAGRAVDAGRLTPAPPATRASPAPAPDLMTTPGRAGPVAHWSGCARRCGRPAGAHVEVVAGPEGYEVRPATAAATRKESR
ncbi:nitrite reductase [Frankia sp. CN7]|uniref:Nitrite reductase n=1 Tax=Frankia nepalensis TaxID=1836974 RepID=A0A937RAB1_9ACTN|nr:nitrite reductase [Frankia nepalensis]MBL7499802.1 nitrite reductase [Frankia nepalensis]MBL7628356.1 nitrite reductase [Frankia nepalensis]